MKSLSALTPRAAVLDGTADFVVNLADLGRLGEFEAAEFLDSNVLTSGMELLLSQAFARLGGQGSASGIYKLSESMGGGKTQGMIVAGILARFPHLAADMDFREPLSVAKPDVVATFTGRSTDKKECRRCVLVIADLQKDWEQGAEELARIMRSNDTLGGTMQSVNNEISKGAQTIAPVDNSKDELYAILRRRLFKAISVSPKDIEAVADAYVAELKKASAIIDRPTMKVREEILVSYPFHFSIPR